jgi:peptidyl-prolyl cis-trans isomerase C
MKGPMRLLAIFPLLLLSASCENCKKGAEESETEPRYGLDAKEASTPVAKVGDRVITAGDFADRLAEQSPYLRARYTSPERRRELLDNMVRFELLALEAERQGYFDRPEVRRAENRVLVEALLREEIDEKIKLTDVTEDEIREYYEAHKGEYDQPEQVRVSHILLTDRAEAEALLRELAANPDDGDAFRQAAKTRSADEATRARYGDLRFVSRPVPGEVTPPNAPPREVVVAAFSLEKIGDLHPKLVETDRGFHIVKLTARRAALQRTVDDVRRIIQSKLYREKREAALDQLVERLKKEAGVELDPSALSAVSVGEEAP